MNKKIRNEKTSLFGFGKNCTLFSYVPKNGENVLLLSALRNDDKIDENTGEQHKLEMITFYNETKEVDAVY